MAAESGSTATGPRLQLVRAYLRYSARNESGTLSGMCRRSFGSFARECGIADALPSGASVDRIFLHASGAGGRGGGVLRFEAFVEALLRAACAVHTTLPKEGALASLLAKTVGPHLPSPGPAERDVASWEAASNALLCRIRKPLTMLFRAYRAQAHSRTTRVADDWGLSLRAFLSLCDGGGLSAALTRRALGEAFVDSLPTTAEWLIACGEQEPTLDLASFERCLIRLAAALWRVAADPAVVDGRWPLPFEGVCPER